MATSRTVRAVQVPGEPTTASAAAPDTDNKAVTDLDAADAAPAAVKVSKGKDYSQIHSSEVDAKKLTKAVLCKDGWVVPDLPPQAAIKA